MPDPIDPELLAGFSDEIDGYLPRMQEALEAFRQSPGDVALLEEPYRYSHIIRGAAAMMGLDPLSAAAGRVEQSLMSIRARVVPHDEAMIDFLAVSIERIQSWTRQSAVEGFDQAAHFADVADFWGAMLEQYPKLADAADDASRMDIDLGEMPAFEAGTFDELPLPDFEDLPGTISEAAPEPATVGGGPDEDMYAGIDGGEEVSEELAEVFAAEAEDHFRIISESLPLLRSDPNDRDLLQLIRRSAHTLKGAAGMVGFEPITRLSHRAEDLLDLLYDGVPAEPADFDMLFAALDCLTDMAARREDRDRVRALYNRFRQRIAQVRSADPVDEATVEAEGPALEPTAEEEPMPVVPAVAAPAAAVVPSEKADKGEGRDWKAGQTLRVPVERLDDLVKLLSELVITRNAFEQRMGDFARQIEELQLSADRLRGVAARLETDYETRTLGRNTLPTFGRDAGLPTNRVTGYFKPQSTQPGEFDSLEMDQYNEFHLISRAISEASSDVASTSGELTSLIGDFESFLNRQSQQSGELQDKLMRVRMVPLSVLSVRLQRTVRNVAEVRNKPVQLTLENEDLELDNKVLEGMVEPLLHLLRNAADHGIESADVRLQRGKPAVGSIRLKAWNEGTQFVIRIDDDGGGIDPRRIRDTAIQNGMLTAEALDRMPEDEIVALIFRAGFSTASKVSEISGRGIGLDIVRAQVQALKGNLTVDSVLGSGTTFTIRLPTTLAIIRGLMVRADGQLLVVPMAEISQILRIERKDIEMVNREATIRVGGRTLPLVHLGRVLNFPETSVEPNPTPPVLIIDLGDKQYALAVDELLGGREIVLKGLGSHVARVPGLLGATLQGDGTVVLIVNPQELLRSSGRGTTTVRSESVRSEARPANESLNVMIVDDSPSVRRVMTNLMKTTGWESTIGKDGLDALEVLQQSNRLPDLILLDVEMPRMDGYEFLSTIRNMEAYRKIPVVFVTSRAGEKHRRKAMETGASGYMVKPYQDEQLLALIRKLVRQAAMPAGV